MKTKSDSTLCKKCNGRGSWFRRNGFCPDTIERCRECKGTGFIDKSRKDQLSIKQEKTINPNDNKCKEIS